MVGLSTEFFILFSFILIFFSVQELITLLLLHYRIHFCYVDLLIDNKHNFSAGHLFAHISTHPAHHHIYSHKLQRVVSNSLRETILLLLFYLQFVAHSQELTLFIFCCMEIKFYLQLQLIYYNLLEARTYSSYVFKPKSF